MSAKRYRVAIVGLGRMGSTIDDEFLPARPPYSIAAACKASPRLEVVAGADIDPAKRAAFGERWGVTALYDDYLTMIQQEAPDLVAICTVGVHHAEMTIRTAAAGTPLIFCEKAMSSSMAEADAVLEAVGSRQIPYNTGVLRRFNRVYHQARDLIAAGEIGEPRCVVHFAATNLLHGHIHAVDTVSFLVGDPPIQSVWGELFPRDLAIVNNHLDKDPNGIFQLVFANGIEATSIHAGAWDFEVIGTRGSVRVGDNGDKITMQQATDPRGRNLVDVPLTPPTPYSPTQACLEDLVAAHEEGRPTLGHVALTHHITEACIAIAESHRQGQRISLPLTERSLYIVHR